MADESLSEAERMAIFLALVQAQDSGMTALQSRESITKRFSISQDALRRIEREGIDGNWPPLG